MAHSPSHAKHEEKLELGPGATRLFLIGAVIGVLGLVAAAFFSSTSAEGFRRFYFAYLYSYAFFLSLALGGLFFILVTYVTRSGWSVAVRRVPEALAKTLPLMLVLSLPMLYSVVASNTGTLYRWDQPPAAHGHDDAHADAAHTHAATKDAAGHAAHAGASDSTTFVGPFGKAVPVENKPNAYNIRPHPPLVDGKPEAPGELVKGKLNSPFLLAQSGWLVRVVLCLVVLSAIAWWYTSSSARQDKTGDEDITRRLAVRSAPLLIPFGLCLTFLSYDLLMSLDPVWYSTMFGPYFFAGCAISVMASTILICRLLQSQGYLKNSINTEHYHDLAKFQFAFTFFWGYLAFSQYMLTWYASIPEELTWFTRRGVSTAFNHVEAASGWAILSWILLFGKLLIPFGGFLSRHVKRNSFGMIWWASWILAFQALDMYWVVMPELNGSVVFGIPEIAAFIGIGGLFVAMFVRGLSSVSLLPVKDPRLNESLAFHQSF